MRFLASFVLGWMLKLASMAAAACLFQKDGFSSSTGRGQHPSAPGHPVLGVPVLGSLLGSHP